MDTQADTELIYQDYVQDQPQTKTIIYIKNNQIRVEEEQNGTYTLFNTQEPMVYIVNSKKSQYVTNDIETTRRRTQKLMIMQQQLKTQLSDYIKRLPSYHQQQAQTYLRQLDQFMNLRLPDPQYRVVDEIEYIHGLACKVTVSTIQGHPIREVCNATGDIIQADNFQSFLALLRFLDNLDRESARLQGKPAPFEGKADTHAAGLAVRIKTLPNVSTTQLISVRRETLDTSLFTIPSHYQLIDPLQPEIEAGVTLEQPFRPSSF